MAGFGPHTGGFLRRLAGYANAGDIIVNGAYDPSTRQVIGIDDLVGAHGGVGGMQTQPFIVYPSGWAEQAPELVGAASVHRFLRRHALGEEKPPDDGLTEAAPASRVRAARVDQSRSTSVCSAHQARTLRLADGAGCRFHG